MNSDYRLQSVLERIRTLILAVLLAMLPCHHSQGASDQANDCVDSENRITECPLEVTDGGAKDSDSEQLVELTQFLESWLNAWGRGDFDAYLDHYVEAISPVEGLSRLQWEKQRKRAVAPERNIQISIELESMGINDQNIIDVVFLQRYLAKGYRDVTKKQLFLVRSGDRLKIGREKTLD